MKETGGTEDDLAARGTHDPLKLPQAARLKPLWPRRRLIVVQHSVDIKEQKAGTSVSWTLADVYAAAHAALVLRRDSQLDHWGAAAPRQRRSQPPPELGQEGHSRARDAVWRGVLHVFINESRNDERSY